jgi:hypothetical protein
MTMRGGQAPAAGPQIDHGTGIGVIDHGEPLPDQPGNLPGWPPPVSPARKGSGKFARMARFLYALLTEPP